MGGGGENLTEVLCFKIYGLFGVFWSNLVMVWLALFFVCLLLLFFGGVVLCVLV